MTANDHVRARLEAMQAELVQRRERIAAHGRDGVPADSAEQVTARENDDVVTSLALQIDGELNEIRAALGRIDNGRYGSCAGCGNAIEPARLEALPFTARCSACADQA